MQNFDIEQQYIDKIVNYLQLQPQSTATLSSVFSQPVFRYPSQLRGKYGSRLMNFLLAHQDKFLLTPAENNACEYNITLTSIASGWSSPSCSARTCVEKLPKLTKKQLRKLLIEAREGAWEKQTLPEGNCYAPNHREMVAARNYIYQNSQAEDSAITNNFTVQLPVTQNDEAGINAIFVGSNNCPVILSNWAIEGKGDKEQICIERQPSIGIKTIGKIVISKSFACLDLEWDKEGIPCLAQLSTSLNECYLIDPISNNLNGLTLMRQALLKCLCQVDYVLLHDLRSDVLKLGESFFEDLMNNGTKVLDTQLVSEFLSFITKRECAPYTGLNAFLESLKVESFSGKRKHHLAMDRDPNYWRQRPLPSSLIQYAASDVLLLHAAIEPLLQELEMVSDTYEMPNLLELLCGASRQRALVSFATRGQRQIEFLTSQAFTMCSQELQSTFKLALGLKDEVEDQDSLNIKSIEVECSMQSVVQLLPKKFQSSMMDNNLSQEWLETCRDFVLDLHGRPYAINMQEERRFLSSDAFDTVNPEDLSQVTDQLTASGFGPDNRAGVDGQLHRISAIRNKKYDIIGLTIRVGRLFHGNAYIVSDLLLNPEYQHQSILVLGPPGSGKTSLIREITRILAMRQTTIVVDTSNEICGDGDQVHPCVGFARRMMVPRIEDQHNVMIECLQNHCPTVMVIDEIGHSKEAIASRTCKTRGVRMIASAHGDFANLMLNGDLQDLLGGIKEVTVGDAEVKRSGGKKLQLKRMQPPTFDIIIEVEKGEYNRLRVIKDVARAVDIMLEGKSAFAEERLRTVDESQQKQQLFMELHRIESLIA